MASHAYFLEFGSCQRIEVFGSLVVGRGPNCGLQLDDLSVSGEHAEVCAKDGRCFVHDLGSTNGTDVNGTRITTSELRHGDRVAFGAVEAVVRSEGRASTSKRSVFTHLKDVRESVARIFRNRGVLIGVGVILGLADILFRSPKATPGSTTSGASERPTEADAQGSENASPSSPTADAKDEGIDAIAPFAKVQSEQQGYDDAIAWVRASGIPTVAQFEEIVRRKFEWQTEGLDSLQGVTDAERLQGRKLLNTAIEAYKRGFEKAIKQYRRETTPAF